MFSFSKIIYVCLTFSSFQTHTFGFKLMSPVSIKPKTSFNFNGDIPPLGFFDPLRIAQNHKDSYIRHLREAELHHSRIAMIANSMLSFIDYFNKDDLAINYFSKTHDEFNKIGLFYMIFFEFTRLLILYKTPSEGLLQFKDNIQPGILNTYIPFDEDMSNVELSNGRLAMIGVIGYIAQEFVTQQKVIS